MLTGPEQKILRKVFGSELVSVLCRWKPEDTRKVCYLTRTGEVWSVVEGTLGALPTPTEPTVIVWKGIPGGGHDLLNVFGQMPDGSIVEAFSFTGPPGSLSQLLTAYGYNRNWLKSQARVMGASLRLQDEIWARYDPEFKYPR